MRLVPVDVARMPDFFSETRGGVSVENRTAERHVLGAVTVAADGEVPAGHHELELSAAGAPENCNRLLLAVPVRVVLQLFSNAFVPIRVVEPQEDLADQVLLVLRIEVAADVELRDVGNVPIIGDARA